jgi:non-ribosomal peptide synthetase component E (peptide arylation enzyme)
MERRKHQSLVDRVKQHANDAPNRRAIVSESGVITYGQLAPKIDRLARSLLKMGIKKGDIVGSYLTRE